MLQVANATANAAVASARLTYAWREFLHTGLLRELGYVDGQNITIERERVSVGEHFESIAISDQLIVIYRD